VTTPAEPPKDDSGRPGPEEPSDAVPGPEVPPVTAESEAAAAGAKPDSGPGIRSGAAEPGISGAAPATAEERPAEEPAVKELAVEKLAVKELAVEAKPQRRIRWLRVLAACTAFVVLALAGGCWYVYQQLNGNITTDTTAEAELKAQEADRPTAGPTKAENILLIGSDNRGNGNEEYGKDTGTQRSDTTILLHLSADRSSATAVSIPRDLMVHVPSCTKADGSTSQASFEQFNWAFETGGAACTIRTVEDMTGIRVDHHLTVDFTGFKKMVDAVGGVDVCVAEPIHDTEAHLDLPAGLQKLDGEQALGYVRARYSIGDGSDTQRMQRQQDFLASLVKKVRSDGVLLNPVKVYPLLSAATSALTADPGLDSLNELYGLAQSIQKTPTGAIRFLTLPIEPYAADHNRDQLQQAAAEQLFTTLRDDLPVTVTDEAGSSTASPSPSGTATSGASATPSGNAATGTPTPVPTYTGTTADRDICGKVQ
jgi:LCP family protein required for cell wall assembly